MSDVVHEDVDGLAPSWRFIIFLRFQNETLDLVFVNVKNLFSSRAPPLVCPKDSLSN